jgi:hypothetical protein
MRAYKLAMLAAFCTVLTACVSSLLIGNQLQNRMMWALLKPLVGFDPNEVNLFELPLVHERMTALLGDNYQPVVTLLRTADKIQQEGALIYVASQVLESEVLPLPEELESARQSVEGAQTQVDEVEAQAESVRDQVRTVQSAAGMVWNGDTNQLAVLLIEAGTSQVFAEQPAKGDKLAPVWPAELKSLLDQDVAGEAPPLTSDQLAE